MTKEDKNNYFLDMVETGNLKKIKKFLKENKEIDINFKNGSALYDAIIHNNLEIVEFLLENGAIIQEYDDIFFSGIAEKSNIKIIEALIKSNPNHVNIIFKSAAEYGALSIIKYLAEKGVSIRMENDHALKWSAFNGHLDVVKYLVTERDQDVNIIKLHNTSQDVKEWVENYKRSKAMSAYLDEALAPKGSVVKKNKKI